MYFYHKEAYLLFLEIFLHLLEQVISSTIKFMKLQIIRFLVFSFICFSFPLMVSSQTYWDYKVKGDHAYDKAQYVEAIEFYHKAFALEKADPGDAYNMACCFSLLKDHKNAFKFINLAIDNGWTNSPWMVKDTDLNYLHAFDEWNNVVSRTQSNKEQSESKLNSSLKDELIEMEYIDQINRKTYQDLLQDQTANPAEIDKAWEKIQQSDRIHTQKMITIVETYGWPTISLAGKEGAHAAWLLTQHADANPQFQEKCLRLMKPHVDKKEVFAKDYAYLYDRVQIAKGEKQSYGTQAFIDPETKRTIFRPIEKEADLDKRRKAMGLFGTASQYGGLMGIKYQLPSEDEAKKKAIDQSKKYQELISKAKSHEEKGENVLAAEYYEIALHLSGDIETIDLLDGAAVHTQLGKTGFDNAFLFLHMAITRGDIKTDLEANSKFKPLQADDRWIELKQRF